MKIGTKLELFEAGVALAEKFCAANGITMPSVVRLGPEDQLYHLATCAFYRPTAIRIMVEKCAPPGMGGRAWSWPGYVIDRTPYGVIQHELGHHVDHVKFVPPQGVFSKVIYEASREEPLTGYLGTDNHQITFYMEWFAENFRLFVTNPDLSKQLRPKFHQVMLDSGFKPVVPGDWETVLDQNQATHRIVDMARKKVEAGNVRARRSLAPPTGVQTSLL